MVNHLLLSYLLLASCAFALSFPQPCKKNVPPILQCPFGYECIDGVSCYPILTSIPSQSSSFAMRAERKDQPLFPSCPYRFVSFNADTKAVDMWNGKIRSIFILFLWHLGYSDTLLDKSHVYLQNLKENYTSSIFGI